jgi:hypothetical protein
MHSIYMILFSGFGVLDYILLQSHGKFILAHVIEVFFLNYLQLYLYGITQNKVLPCYNYELTMW